MASPIAYLTTSSISFEDEGDFVVVNNDLKSITNSIKIRIEALKDLLKSNYGDYFYFKNLAGDLDKFLGRGIDKSFQIEVENHVRNVIINSSLFDETEFNIYSVTDLNTIYLRIFIAENTEQEDTINLTYNTETGVSFG